MINNLKIECDNLNKKTQDLLSTNKKCDINYTNLSKDDENKFKKQILNYENENKIIKNKLLI